MMTPLHVTLAGFIALQASLAGDPAATEPHASVRQPGVHLPSERAELNQLILAQARVTREYLENLQRRLAGLETAAATGEPDESLLREIRDTKEAIDRVREDLEQLQKLLDADPGDAER